MNTLHVVSHTHWDREWYRTFQEFRFRLVHTVDGLLDLMERDPGYRHFTLDGQTIVLDDYLAVRPEQEPRLRRLIQQGRLVVGPWYVLPDEFLEGPEAMVRNLLFGREGCRRFTPQPQPMERIFYVPDSFGHPGQLPQIAAGFGHDALCLWRGVGDLPTEFRWSAPDGTERLMLFLRHSYSSGAWLAADREGFIRDLRAERDALAPHTTTRHLLVMQGTDHMQARADLADCLEAAHEALGDTVLHSTLPAYLAAVQDELRAEGLSRLPLFSGELRNPQRAHLLPAVLSARTWIKQRNTAGESLLTRWAEPFSAIAEQMPGGVRYRGLLRESWVWLLQNHPHDSICGCSVDPVHREMRTRFDWSEQIAEQVTAASLDAIARQVDTRLPDGAAGAAIPILVFNPAPGARTGRVRVHLPRIPDTPWAIADGAGRPVPFVAARSLRVHFDERMSRERLAAFLAQVAASQGPYGSQVQYRSVETRAGDGVGTLDVVIRRTQPGDCPGEGLAEAALRAQALLADDSLCAFHLRVSEEAGAEVDLLAPDVPGLGYAQFWAAPAVRAGGRTGRAERGPETAQNTDAGGPIENEFYTVDADPADGTLTVTDRATGLRLSGVNRFVDGGDRGDEYTFCPPEQDLVVGRPAAPPAIHRLDDPLGQTLSISLHYEIPRSLAEGNRAARSAERVALPIVTRVTLTPGVRRVDFETTVSNNAEDHRLRVLFPAPIATDHSSAESHFDVVERPLRLPAGTAGWAEQPVGTHPQLTFVDVSDGTHGVMLCNRGLPEYELLPGAGNEPGVALALTLLRCVGWLSRGDLSTRAGYAGPLLPTPEAQCPGEHTFRYALIPHAGDYVTSQHEAHAFAAPLRAICPAEHEGSLPRSGALVEVWPQAVILSAVKPPQEGEGIVVRVYNSTPAPVEAGLRLWRPFREALLVRMDEAAAVRSLAAGSDTVALPLRGKEIATVRIHFAERPA